MLLLLVRGLCWPRSVDRLLFHLNLCRKWQSAKIDKNRPAGRKPTGRRFEMFCCLFTWYSSYSWPEFSCGGARLFLSGRSGLNHSDSKTAWRRPPVGRHAFNCWGQKESGGLDFSKPPPVNDKLRVEMGLPSSGFFLFCRWADHNEYENEHLFRQQDILAFCILLYISSKKKASKGQSQRWKMVFSIW